MANPHKNNKHGVESLGNGTFRINFISHKDSIAASKRFQKERPFNMALGQETSKVQAASAPRIGLASENAYVRGGAGGGDGTGEEESGYGIGQSALVGSSPPPNVQAPQQQLQQQQMQMLPETFPVPAECFRVLASDSALVHFLGLMGSGFGSGLGMGSGGGGSMGSVGGYGSMGGGGGGVMGNTPFKGGVGGMSPGMSPGMMGGYEGGMAGGLDSDDAHVSTIYIHIHSTNTHAHARSHARAHTHTHTNTRYTHTSHTHTHTHIQVKKVNNATGANSPSARLRDPQSLPKKELSANTSMYCHY
jgi:hypothetical protein